MVGSGYCNHIDEWKFFFVLLAICHEDRIEYVINVRVNTVARFADSLGV